MLSNSHSLNRAILFIYFIYLKETMQFDMVPMLGFVGLLHPQLNDLNHNLNHSVDSKLSYNMKNENVSENG